MNVPRTSVVAFPDHPTTDGDTLALGDPNDFARRGPPVSFRGEPGVVHAEAGMAGLGVAESACIVDFEYSPILDGSANERVFEMEGKSWLGEG